MRFRFVSLICLLALSLTLVFVTQVNAASAGCDALNIIFTGGAIAPAGMSGGSFSIGIFDLEAGEVVSVSMDPNLSGGVALQDGGGITLASALLPSAAVYTVPSSGSYSLMGYRDVSNHTAGAVSGDVTVSCSSSAAPDNRLTNIPNGAVYATEEGGISAYGITNFGEGAYVTITPEQLAELPANPDENMLLGGSGDGFTTVWLLTTGEYQVNIGPDRDGNVYVIVFTGVPATNIYRLDFNVNDILYP
jgi:hypothetical protein